MIETLNKLAKFEGAEITPNSITAELAGGRVRVNITANVRWTQPLPEKLVKVVRVARTRAPRLWEPPHPERIPTASETARTTAAEALQKHLERKIRRALGKKNATVTVREIDNGNSPPETDFAGGSTQRVTAANVEKLKQKGAPLPDPYAPYDDRGGITAQDISRSVFAANIQLTINRKTWVRQKKGIPKTLPTYAVPGDRARALI